MTAPGPRGIKAGIASALPMLMLLGWWAMALALALTPAWRRLELKLLDALIVASAPNKSNYPITIVGIDAESFATLGMQWPWPRSLHADLLDRLTADGAAVVAFDVLFSETSARGAQDDQRFADAIKRAGNVVLAADRIYRETASTNEWQRLEPLPLFLEAGAQVGLATVPLDPDLVVRQAPESTDALWRTTVLQLIRNHPELTPNLGTPAGAYIRYVGGDHTFQYVSYHELVKPTGSVPDGFFKDQVVVVGFAAKASANVQSAQSDLFLTPFMASTGGMMTGAEVHANLIETALNRTAIMRLPDVAVAALLALVMVLGARAMRNWRPLRSALLGAGIATVLAAAVWVAMLRWNLWLPAASMLAVLALMYVGVGGRTFVQEQARRAQITRTFALYVTPQVVRHMISHPEEVKLGGVRRDITMMFTDLAGFTTISETMSPETVTHLLNRHFTEMTDIVLAHHGTVARFIGDAIMAFWGAPLDDDDQAYRAVAAAIAMQKQMETTRADFIREGLPPIHMRVGIHSGPAVVGNLGSAKRFDYTAIGDDVNLAARLEGANKLYDTTTLVSEETVKRVQGRLGLRPVDKVVVKGKTRAVEIFTPCSDQRLVDLGTRAIRLYRDRQWDDAQALLEQLLAMAPGDRIATLYIERIDAFRATPPDADWDGSTALDKL